MIGEGLLGVIEVVVIARTMLSLLVPDSALHVDNTIVDVIIVYCFSSEGATNAAYLGKTAATSLLVH